MTVVAAFDELVAEGWIVMRAARGAFVSSDLPDPRPRRFARERVAVRRTPLRAPYEVGDVPEPDPPYAVPRGSLLFAPSRPDVRLAPAEVIGRAYRRAISRGGGSLLSYAAPEGHHRLRIALAKMLASTRGLSATHENICVTRGSQMAISLLARVLVRPGDVIAVEQLGYRPAYETFRLAGAKVVPVPVDEHGLDTDALEHVLEQQPIRAVYVTPHHQFPTTVTLSAARRMRLLELARQHRFAIIEDDYDYEFHYEGSPVLPLASADPHGVVIYVGTMSKVLAPALRIGYVAAPRNVIERIAASRSFVDSQGDTVLEYALATLLEEGEIQRHIRRVRRAYHERRDTLVAELRDQFGDALTFVVPAGGIALWVRANPPIDVTRWIESSARAGAIIVGGASYTFSGRAIPFVRLGFASLNANEIREGVRRLRAALDH